MYSIAHVDKWEHYRDTRRGDYAFRSRTRYAAVVDRLVSMGLCDGMTVLDIGAGTCQFGRYLRERGFRVNYWPVDAVLDGADLESYRPPRADFIVAIEVLEHVRECWRLLDAMQYQANRGVVITTPNCETVDVLGCDPTHVSIVYPNALTAEKWNVERCSWFGVQDDTLLAWRPNANANG